MGLYRTDLAAAIGGLLHLQVHGDLLFPVTEHTELAIYPSVVREHIVIDCPHVWNNPLKNFGYLASSFNCKKLVHLAIDNNDGTTSIVVGGHHL